MTSYDHVYDAVLLENICEFIISRIFIIARNLYITDLSSVLSLYRYGFRFVGNPFCIAYIVHCTVSTINNIRALKYK